MSGLPLEKFGFDYNRLYDSVYDKAGLTLDQMRVASPFLDQAKESLELYRRIEPGNVDKASWTGTGARILEPYTPKQKQWDTKTLLSQRA